jgi:hypothetical protein
MFLRWILPLSASIIEDMTQCVFVEHVFLEMTAVNAFTCSATQALSVPSIALDSGVT